MTGFTPLVPPHIVPNGSSQRPVPFPAKERTLSPAIRDSMTLTSWLLLGGLVQGLLLLTLGPMALIPTVLVLLYRTVDHILMAYNITPNRYLNGVINARYSAQTPNADGTFGLDPAAQSIVVFHLGARSNHPFGPLAPGMRDLSRRAIAMNKAMAADPVKYGLLGLSHYIKQESVAGNDTMTVYYLRDYEALHRFAHDELHMEGVRWYAKYAKQYPHIAIFHETYLVPKGQWENIYANSKPTGMGDTWFPVMGKDDAGSVTQFVRPIVDIRSGPLRSASRRLNMPRFYEQEDDDDKYEYE
jgi:hypothetical protein